ncbi:MAG: SMP-30/gluconolactonase/LRE family protein [Myxococcota bacterium]
MGDPPNARGAHVLSIATLLLLGCRPEVPDPPDTDTDAPVDTDLPGPPVVDCSAPLPPFELGEPLPAPRANRSLAIAGDTLVGWDTTSLIRSTGPHDAALWVPEITAFGGMVFLDDGSLVVSEHLRTENVLRVQPEGGVEILATGLRAYGIVKGPDGRIWATAEPDTIYRIDPDTGEVDASFVLPADVLPRISDFSPAGDRLYVGTRNEQGTIWAFDLDSDGEPAEGVPFATTEGTFHDVLVVDACGDLYVTAYEGSAVYRISPDGEVETLATFQPVDHVHGAAFGSGVGAWDDHTLYVAQPNRGNLVSAWPLGRPARDWRGGDYTVSR